MDVCNPDGLVPVAVTSSARCAFLPSTAEKRPALGWGIRELLKEGKDASTRGVQLKRSPGGSSLLPAAGDGPSAAPHREHQPFRAPSLTEAKQNPALPSRYLPQQKIEILVWGRATG